MVELRFELRLFVFTGLLNLKARGFGPTRSRCPLLDIRMKSYGNGLVANPKSISERPEAMAASQGQHARLIDAIADPKAAPPRSGREPWPARRRVRGACN